MLNKLFQGMIFALGFLLIIGTVGLGSVMFFAGDQFNHYFYKIKEKAGVVRYAEPLPEPVSVLRNFYNNQRTPVPSGLKTRYVNGVESLTEALTEAHQAGGNFVIYLTDGEYKIDKTIRINVPNLYIMSVSGDPYKNIIRGPGMRSSIGNLFRVNQSGFVLDGITLSDASYHLVQIAGEKDVDNVEFRNMIFQDSFQQLIKISYDSNSRPENRSDFGVIENSILQFTKGIAENYYTGGIDGIGASNWLIKNNVFRDIASPNKHIAQHAVHFWINAKDNRVINNVFVNNDRSIGFGMKSNARNLEYNHVGGEIRDNLIIHTDDDPFADTGIVLEESQGTIVSGNYIFLANSYPRAIEYRFEGTVDVEISNNTVNKKIQSRDGGQAFKRNNTTSDDKALFFQKLIERLNALNVESLY